MRMIPELILRRFDEHWESIGHVAVATTSKQVWLDLPFDPADEATLGGRFGWAWPGIHLDPKHPQHPWLVAYCPEILAEITAHLSDEDRDEYLKGVQYLCDGFIADMDDEDTNLTDPEYRERLRRELAENFPYTGKLMAEVEERAVALGIVPAELGGTVSTDLVCTTCGYVNPVGTYDCSICGGSL